MVGYADLCNGESNFLVVLKGKAKCKAIIIVGTVGKHLSSNTEHRSPLRALESAPLLSR